MFGCLGGGVERGGPSVVGKQAHSIRILPHIVQNTREIQKLTYLRREGAEWLPEQRPAEVGQERGPRPHGEDAGLWVIFVVIDV